MADENKIVGNGMGDDDQSGITPPPPPVPGSEGNNDYNYNDNNNLEVSAKPEIVEGEVVDEPLDNNDNSEDISEDLNLASEPMVEPVADEPVVAEEVTSEPVAEPVMPESVDPSTEKVVDEPEIVTPEAPSFPEVPGLDIDDEDEVDESPELEVDHSEMNMDALNIEPEDNNDNNVNDDVVSDDLDVAPEPVAEPVIPESVDPSNEKVADEPTGEKVKPKGKHRFMFLIIALVAVLLSLLVFGLFLFLSSGDTTNPLLQTLGVESASITAFLLLAVVVIFGILSLLSFLGIIVNIFKFMNTKREDKPKKKKALVSFIVSGVAFALFLAITILVLSKLQTLEPAGPKDSDYIATTPAETVGLSTPVSIIFDASNLPIDTDKFRIISYNWDFNDGETATGPTVSHTFTKKDADGIYEVKLTVNYQEIGNSEILEEEFIKIVSIDNEKVFASFTADKEEGPAPLDVEFDAGESLDPDGQIVLYEWDFDGDAEFDDEGEVVEYRFDKPGTYDVLLRVTDNNGEFATISQLITVKGDDIITANISLNPDDEILTPDRSYQFDASKSSSEEGDIVGYKWTFGDGQSGVGRVVNHSYSKEGVYRVVLQLEDEAGNEYEYEEDVTVSKSSSGLFASIQTVPEARDGVISGMTPLKINFDAGGSSGGSIVEYRWDYDGDGVIDDTGQNVNHTFIESGEYETTLIIVSSNNKTAVKTIKVVAESPGLQAKVSANPVNGVVPLTVQFDASATRVPSGSQIVTFQWDFGDGSAILRSGALVSHKFTKIGIFNVKVRAITSDNNFSDATVTVHVNTVSLKSCFRASRVVGPAPLTVQLDPSCAQGTIQQYTWDFGGLGKSNQVKPTFTFNTKGVYEVELEVVDSDNNVSTFTDTITVE